VKRAAAIKSVRIKRDTLLDILNTVIDLDNENRTMMLKLLGDAEKFKSLLR